jgi:hypothetical protein
MDYRNLWPELPITLSCVHCRVDFNKCTLYNGQPYARVDLSPMPESTLSPSPEVGTINLAPGTSTVVEMKARARPRTPRDNSRNVRKNFFKKMVEKWQQCCDITHSL